MRSRRHRWSTSAFVSLLTLGSPAAWSASSAFSPTMSGVVHLPDGRPAANITLEAAACRDDFEQGVPTSSVASRALFTIRTDARGRYRADLAPGGEPDLSTRGDRAEFSGFLICPQGLGWAPLRLEVNAEHPWVRHRIRLRTGDQVRGTVVAYPGNLPLPGAKVYAFLGSGFLPDVIFCQTEADGEGRFAIPASLPPGEYGIGAAAEGYGFLAEDRRATGGAGAQRDLTLRLIRDFRFQGQVIGTDGVPLGHQPITILVEGDDSNVIYPHSQTGLDTTTDAEGRFNYTFRNHQPKTPLSKAYRHLTIYVRLDDHVSNQVTVDAIAGSEAELVFALPR